MVRSWRKDDLTCTSEVLRLGLYYATCAYNLYASSLPTYIAQLEPYPEEFQAIERSCLAKAAVGPHAWALPSDLFRLKDHYGQVANFRSIEHAALAAKVCVYRYENESRRYQCAAMLARPPSGCGPGTLHWPVSHMEVLGRQYRYVHM